jgi:hypothetical protein
VTLAPRLRLAALAALVGAAVLAAVLLFTGGADGGTGKLAWATKPQVFKSAKPTDRVLTARIENASLRPISLDVDDGRILNADGDELKGTVSFLQAFAHGLWSWSQAPAKLTDFERRRLGQIVTIKPGETAPIALSWRVPEGEAQPVRVDFGDGAALDLPKAR